MYIIYEYELNITNTMIISICRTRTICIPTTITIRCISCGRFHDEAVAPQRERKKIQNIKGGPRAQHQDRTGDLQVMNLTL